MKPMAHGDGDPSEILRRSIENDRIHAAYLLTGTGALPTETARRFARALVCTTGRSEPCEACLSCQRSREPEPGSE